MEAVFLKLLNMSLTAGWLVLAVILLRPLLKKAPKWIRVLLWGMVALRLSCPVSIESALSLIPSAVPVPQEILISHAPAVDSGVPALDQAVESLLFPSLMNQTGDSAAPVQMILAAASLVWLLGAVGMLLYMAVSYMRIRHQVQEAIPLKKNIYICDHIRTPFILGIIRPRIYLPSAMDEKDMVYVIAHEKAHLQRKDHLWKPLGFFLLSVYWFSPLLWIAYVLLCKDIELACDEKVLRQYGPKVKKPYSEALVNCSVPRKMIAACPLAFGEVSVKERVKDVLNYKKPAFWIILVAVAACIITAVCFLTDPSSQDPTQPVTENDVKIQNTIEGNMKTYFQMSDDTWQCDGLTYQYRLEISGTMPGSTAETTYVYLSNLEDISFEEAWKAAGYSSSSEEYFSPEEAVLVETRMISQPSQPSQPVVTDPDEEITEPVLEDDMRAFEKYFSPGPSGDKLTIGKEYAVLMGESNGWRIYHVTYRNEIVSPALCSETLGGYTFYSSSIHHPYSIAIYAIKNGEIYTLTEAYDKGLIDIKEVYDQMPDSIKQKPGNYVTR